MPEITLTLKEEFLELVREYQRFMDHKTLEVAARDLIRLGLEYHDVTSEWAGLSLVAAAETCPAGGTIFRLGDPEVRFKKDDEDAFYRELCSLKAETLGCRDWVVVDENGVSLDDGGADG